MHQNGKEEDSSTGSANQAAAFGSNTFPLLSRSSMKRPFSLSSEREQQISTIRDHYRCRGFRSRSKTIHSDTLSRPSHYRELIGQVNTFGIGCSNSTSERTSMKGFFESTRRKSSTQGNLSSDRQSSHLRISESILNDAMAVDEEDDDEEEEDEHLTMLLNAHHQDVPSTAESKPKSGKAKKNDEKGQPQTGSKTSLQLNSHPASLVFSAGSKSKGCLHLGPNGPQHSGGQMAGTLAVHKLAITFAPKPTANCDTAANFLVLPHEPSYPKPDVAGQGDLSSNGSFPPLAIASSLSPLAVPKSAASLLDSKASPLLAATAHIPTEAEKADFQRSLDSATTLVFHRRTGLPLTSSPAPIRKYGTCFDFDSSLTSVNAIKKALFENDARDSVVARLRSRISFSTPTTTSALLGNFEESVLNGRLEPASIVNGFTAEIGASGDFCPKHKTLPVTVFFYALQDSDKGDKISSPYLGHINLGPKGYTVPRKGTVQVTLFNPNETVVKMFVINYDLSEMPKNSRTFLRQRTLFMPSNANEHDADNRKWLRYLIHLRFQSSKSGRIRLHTDMRVLVFRKHDLDVATLNSGVPYELRSFIQMPSNPKYSKNIKS